MVSKSAFDHLEAAKSIPVTSMERETRGADIPVQGQYPVRICSSPTHGTRLILVFIDTRFDDQNNVCFRVQQ